MAQFDNALEFVKSADLPAPRTGVEAGGLVETGVISPNLNLDKLPDGVVSSNTLIDYSAVSLPEVRSGVSLAMLFADRAARALMKEGDDEDDWLAAYKTNLTRLGFQVPQSAVTTSHFKKSGLFVHKAIIPFLTIALRGATLGPVIIAALDGLKGIDAGKPWVTLFERESRRFSSRELCFAAVTSDALSTTIRHVMARLSFGSDSTSILFFKLNDARAEFESVTTTMTANNDLLAAIEPQLRTRLGGEIGTYIATAALAEQGSAATLAASG